MKPEGIKSCLIGSTLAFLIAFGGLGCVVTAFGLDTVNMWQLAAVCALAALGTGVCFRLKWGGTLVLCVAALMAGIFWHSRVAENQLRELLYRISYIYNLAYGWGVLYGKGVDTGVTYPLAAVGCLVAGTVTWSVCRRKRAVFPVLTALIPLVSCLMVTDTVPAAGYLYILILGLTVLVITSALRRDSESQANWLTWMAAPAAALALGGLFLAMPRESYVNPTLDLQKQILAWVEEISGEWEEGSNSGQLTGSGRSPEVDLRSLGPRVRHTYPVLEAVTGEGGVLYLREQAYEQYDGGGWKAGGLLQETFGGGNSLLRPAGRVKIVTTRGRELMFMPYYPSGQFALVGGRMPNPEKATHYEYTRLALPGNWRENLTGADENRWPLAGGEARYLALPEFTRLRAENILRNILREEDSNTEKADAIAAWVRNCAIYDQDTDRMPPEAEDFAVWFLEEGETGYCVHFATAATVLLRAAGVPARYVTGYMAPVEASTPTTVSADQAHAWAEYYEPRLGIWIPLEVTPADPAGMETVPGTTETGEPATEQPEETEETDATETESSPEREPTEAEPTMPELVIHEDRVDVKGNPLPLWLRRLLKWMLVLAVLMAVVLAQRELRLNRRRKRMNRGDANARALARWREAELLYHRLGKEPPGELESLAQKARFSQHSLTEEELGQFDRHLILAKRACREKAWYRRLVDRFWFAAY